MIHPAARDLRLDTLVSFFQPRGSAGWVQAMATRAGKAAPGKRVRGTQEGNLSMVCGDALGHTTPLTGMSRRSCTTLVL